MLPKIDLPLFELILPSSKETIKYRPFTVKEEKILLVAAESDDVSQQITAIKQVVSNCCFEIDATKLPMFDLEYLLLALRSRSVDNGITFNILDPDTEEKVSLELDLDKVQLTTDKDHTNEVKINDDYILYLKYPTIDEFLKITTFTADDPLASYFIMISCLDKVASADEVFEFKNYTENEVNQFMEDVSGDVVKGIQRFFETMPKLRHEMHYKNNNGDDKTFVVEGIRSFFS